MLKNEKKAIEFYKKAIEFSDNKEYKKAKLNYEKAIEFNPNFVKPYNNLAFLLISYFSEHEKAKEYLEKAIELDSNNADYNMLAIVLIKYFNEFEKAEEYLNKAIELNPNDATAYNNLGVLFGSYIKKHNKAKQFYEKAIELNPKDAKAYYNLHNLFKNHFNEEEKAKLYYEKYTELIKADDVNFTWQASKKIKAIDSISIKNYYSIKNIQINNLKAEKEIYFLGENGDGKTILLQAIFLAFQQHFIENYANKNYVGNVLEAIEQNKNLFTEASDNNDSVFKSKAAKYAENIYAYGVNRNKIENGKEDKYNFMTLFSNEIKLQNPSEWLQELDYYEKSNDYSQLPLSKAKEILKTILNNNVEIEVNHKEVKYIERGTSLEFHELSDGYRSVLTLVADLIVKFSRKQPNVKDTSDFEGIVLIDEIDLHLHPKWAFTIVRKLKEWFPKIQWFITTHNPIITLGASEDAVFYKLYKEDGEVKINEPIKKLNMTANSLITSLLWRLDSFTTTGIKTKSISSDDYIYQKIHEVISKRIQNEPKLMDNDIMKMIETELEKIDALN